MNEKNSMKPTTFIGQVLLYGLFAVLIGVFSQWPTYQPLGPDQAMIKLSFSHHGKTVSECRATSAAELAKLPPNMRAPMQCPRERSPVKVELDVDGVASYRRVSMPSGLSKDGASAVYHRLQLPAGPHRVDVRMSDDAKVPGFGHVHSSTVVLKPAQILVIDFDASKGGITLQ
jgi:hypothetical protein